MADRWSNPSGSVGQQRFRVWPAGSDSYDHVELTANWDHVDGIIGSPPSGQWPPTEGINGGIYKLIKDILDRLDDLEIPPSPDDPPVFSLDDKYIIGYGTAFPTSPPDGKHFVLVSSTSNPTWAYHCRWVAAASAWIVNGETPLTNVNTSNVDIDTFSLSLTLPRPGTYKVQVGGTLSWNPDPSFGGHLYLNGPGGTQAFLDAGIGNYAGNRFAHAASVVSSIGTVTAGSSVSVSGASTGGGFSGGNSYKRVQNGWIAAWPIKLT